MGGIIQGRRSLTAAARRAIVEIPAPRAGKRRGTTMVQKSYRSWLIVLALLGAGLDQTSKYGVFRWLNQDNRGRFANDSGSYEVVTGWFRLHTQYTAEPAGDSALRNWSSDRMPRVNHG